MQLKQLFKDNTISIQLSDYNWTNVLSFYFLLFHLLMCPPIIFCVTPYLSPNKLFSNSLKLSKDPLHFKRSHWCTLKTCSQWAMQNLWWGPIRRNAILICCWRDSDGFNRLFLFDCSIWLSCLQQFCMFWDESQASAFFRYSIILILKMFTNSIIMNRCVRSICVEWVDFCLQRSLSS